MFARAYRWGVAQWPFVAVVVLVLAAFAYLVLNPAHWGRACAVIAVGVILAGVLRAALPTRRIGMLAVRSRWLDSVAYLVVGGLILGLDIRLHG